MVRTVSTIARLGSELLLAPEHSLAWKNVVHRPPSAKSGPKVEDHVLQDIEPNRYYLPALGLSSGGPDPDLYLPRCQPRSYILYHPCFNDLLERAWPRFRALRAA